RCPPRSSPTFPGPISFLRRWSPSPQERRPAADSPPRNHMTIFILSLIAAVLGFGMTLSPLGAIASFIFVGFFAWLGLPTLAWGFYGLPFLFAFVVVISVLVNGLLSESRKDSPAWGIAGLGAGVAVLWLVAIPFVTTASLF